MAQTKILTIFGAALATLLAAGASAEDVADARFLQNAIQTDIAEVKLGELALQRSNDDAVRELAHRLQADHSASMQEAAALAKSLGIMAPAAPTEAAQQHYAALTKLSGQEFDVAFVSHMVEGHRAAVAAFGEQIRANPSHATASFAMKSLPTLREHLAIAESLLAGNGALPAVDPHEGSPSGQGADEDPHLRVPPQAK